MSNNWDKLEITDLQKQIIIGTVLGDSSIRYVYKGAKNPNLTFSHCEKQMEYGLYKFNLLKNIMSSYCKRHIINSWGNHVAYQFTGKNCRILKQFREVFYPKGTKILNVPYLRKNFTEISLAFLFMDDGNRCGKTINLCLYSFDIEELKDFVKFMEDRFNLLFTIKKDKTLYLRQQSMQTFVDLVFDYLHPCTLYKINDSSHKTPLNGETPMWDNTVLNLPAMEENA